MTKMTNVIGFGVVDNKSEILPTLDTNLVEKRIAKNRKCVRYFGSVIPKRVYEAMEILVKGNPVYVLKGMSGVYPVSDFEVLN